GILPVGGERGEQVSPKKRRKVKESIKVRDEKVDKRQEKTVEAKEIKDKEGIKAKDEKVNKSQEKPIEAKDIKAKVGIRVKSGIKPKDGIQVKSGITSKAVIKVKEGVKVKDEKLRDDRVAEDDMVSTVYKPKEGMSDLCRVFKCQVCHGLPTSSKTRCLAFPESAADIPDDRKSELKGKGKMGDRKGKRFEGQRKKSELERKRKMDDRKGEGVESLRKPERSTVAVNESTQWHVKQAGPCDIMSDICFDFKCGACWGTDPTAVCFAFWGVPLEIDLMNYTFSPAKKEQSRHGELDRLDRLLDEDLGDEDELIRLLEEEWGQDESDAVLNELSFDGSIGVISDEDEEDVWYDAEGSQTDEIIDNGRQCFPEDDFEGLEIPFDKEFDTEFYKKR
ncbi:hypothetical protein BGZ68_001967, partial [Mortierella alpina]